MIAGVNAICTAYTIYDVKSLVTLSFVIITYKWQTKRKVLPVTGHEGPEGE